jgi:hypothetical protein
MVGAPGIGARSASAKKDARRQKKTNKNFFVAKSIGAQYQLPTKVHHVPQPEDPANAARRDAHGSGGGVRLVLGFACGS